MGYCAHSINQQRLDSLCGRDGNMDKVAWMLKNSDLNVVKVNNKYILQSWEGDYSYDSLEDLCRDLELAYDEWMKEEQKDE